jgi:hypothetical protein
LEEEVVLLHQVQLVRHLHLPTQVNLQFLPELRQLIICLLLAAVVVAPIPLAVVVAAAYYKAQVIL